MNAATQPAFAATSEVTGRTLYRFVFKIGQTYRVGERWSADDVDARLDAMQVAADWADGRRFKMLHVYPVPATFVEGRGHIVGGP